MSVPFVIKIEPHQRAQIDLLVTDNGKTIILLGEEVVDTADNKADVKMAICGLIDTLYSGIDSKKEPEPKQ